jgi:hypothetical protein
MMVLKGLIKRKKWKKKLSKEKGVKVGKERAKILRKTGSQDYEV